MTVPLVVLAHRRDAASASSASRAACSSTPTWNLLGHVARAGRSAPEPADLARDRARRVMVGATVLALVGIGLGATCSTAAATASRSRRFAGAVPGAASRLAQDKFCVDELYDALIVRPFSALAQRPVRRSSTASSSTRSLVDGVGVRRRRVRRASRALVQNGDGQRYLAGVRHRRGAAGRASRPQPTAPFTTMKVTVDRPQRRASTRAVARAPRRAPLEVRVRLRRRTARATSRAWRPRPATTYDRAGQLHGSRSPSGTRAGAPKTASSTKVEVQVMGVLGWVTLLAAVRAPRWSCSCRDDEEAMHRGLGLLTTIVTFLVSLLILRDFDAGKRRLPARGRQRVDRAARHPLQPGVDGISLWLVC